MPTFRNTLSVPFSYLPAYEDGTVRVFRNFGIETSHTGESSRRKHATFTAKMRNYGQAVVVEEGIIVKLILRNK
jgi:hypothetical protein